MARLAAQETPLTSARPADGGPRSSVAGSRRAPTVSPQAHIARTHNRVPHSVVGRHRSTQRRPKAPTDDAEPRLREHLRDFARRHPRLGWRKAHAVAHREGLVTNPKRTRRVWRDERLQRPPQRKAKRRRLTDGTAARLRGCAPSAPTTCGPWTSSSTRPPTCAASSCSTSSTSSPARHWPSRPPTASTPTASPGARSRSRCRVRQPHRGQHRSHRPQCRFLVVSRESLGCVGVGQ